MATIFTRIIAGELPGRFVWKDDHCVVFMTIEPLTPGHALVVPRTEVDHWLDLDPELVAHLNLVGQKIGQGIQDAFGNQRVGLIVAGFEVPHVHLHVFGADSMEAFDFSRVDRNASADSLDRAADRLRAALRTAGHSEVVD